VYFSITLLFAYRYILKISIIRLFIGLHSLDNWAYDYYFVITSAATFYALLPVIIVVLLKWYTEYIKIMKTNPGCQLYFAYGSNLLRRQMKQRCPSAVYLGIAKLKNWRFEYDGGKNEGWSNLPVANITPTKGSSVWGALYQMTDAEVHELDQYECVPRDYQHHVLAVMKSNGSHTEAFAYVRKPRLTGMPSARYMQTVVSGARSDKLPINYVRRILRHPFTY
jgi:gamma-glutamylcyclotransferase